MEERSEEEKGKREVKRRKGGEKQEVVKII